MNPGTVVLGNCCCYISRSIINGNACQIGAVSSHCLVTNFDSIRNAGNSLWREVSHTRESKKESGREIGKVRGSTCYLIMSCPLLYLFHHVNNIWYSNLAPHMSLHQTLCLGDSLQRAF